jgi:hypothetical protein
MSRNNLGQICPNRRNYMSVVENRKLSKQLADLLRANGLNRKDLARDLNISPERAKNWYDKNIGMTAFDLYSIIRQYDFIHDFIFRQKNREHE